RRHLFGDAGGATRALAQVVELRAANGALGGDLDLVEAGRVYREGALDADAVGRLAHRERLAGAGPAAPEDGSLEDLDAFLVALDDAHVNLDGVARPEGRDVLPPLLGLYDI